MAGDKELFNQDLKTSLGLLDRIAIGVPGLEGCDNMLASVFISLCQTGNIETGNFTNSDLSAGIWTFNHSYNTVFIELIIFDNDGIKQSVDGIMQIVNDSQFTVNFGGSISGIWSYILKYYNT